MMLRQNKQFLPNRPSLFGKPLCREALYNNPTT